MKFNFRNIRWKSVLSATLAVLIVVGAVVGLAAFVNNDSKTISSTIFSRGSIDEATGVYVESTTSLYNKELIECQGLKIDPAFDTAGTYQVFYYGEYKSYLGATEKIRSSAGVYERGDDFPIAKYCRIVITPDAPIDEDGKVEEDFKIDFWEVLGYANDYTVTVDKDQKYSAPDLFYLDEAKQGKMCSYNDSTLKFEEVNAVNDTTYYMLVDVSGVDSLKFIYSNDQPSGEYSVFFYDQNDKFIGHKDLSSGLTEIIIDLPENIAKVGIGNSIERTFSIYPIA